MSEKEIYQLMLKKGRLIYNETTKELTVSTTVYEILGLPRRGIRDIESIAIQYRDLWPAGIKSGGYYVKSGISTISGKLRKFLKSFPQYSPEDVLNATRRYVGESRRDNYQFMKTAEYFIYKDESSVLETYCEVVKGKEVSNPQSNLRVG